MSEAHEHCAFCFKQGPKCLVSNCAMVSCINSCGFSYHACKSDEHLENLCANALVACINESNGCGARMLRKERGLHLERCVASVVRCGSYRVRSLLNRRNEKSVQLKWPDPIEQQKNGQLTCSNPANINEILLGQEMSHVKKMAAECPLKFHRLYGHLIGLDVGKDYSHGRFSFMRVLLKSVKSRVFKDIETENCIIYNDEEGCLACQSRIRNLEAKRFNEMKLKHLAFYHVLKDVENYAEFVEQRVFEKSEFLAIYEKNYACKRVEDEVEEALNLTSEEVNSKLMENNREILGLIELNSSLKVNVAKELPCDAFSDQYESYRLKETTFACDCDLTLRRDEFAQHYRFFHDFLLPHVELVHQSCPLKEYGCRFFKPKIEFLFKGAERPSLVEEKFTNCLAFNFEDSTNTENYSQIGILDLPHETMRSICEQFLQTRGIVYPKWIQVEKEALKTGKKKFCWKIEKLAYSFSKNIHTPDEIKLKANDLINMHLSKCEFKVTQPKQMVKVCPPFN